MACDKYTERALGYLRLAYEIAAEKSTDPSTQNGAILVSGDEWGYEINGDHQVEYNKRGREFISSANFFPRGVKESQERWTRPLKYSFVEHAERNVIYLAARKGFRTEGATMYCTWAACADCARAIIQAGVTEVIEHDSLLHKEQVSWQDSINIAKKMFEEAGVRFTSIPGHFGIKIRFNGQTVEV